MDYREVKRLAQQGEGTHIEFKQKVYYPHKILREIVAFANTEGGYLLIGVTDDGQLKGVKNPDGEIFELERFMKKYCVPYPDYDTYRIELRDERVVVVFDIKEHAPKPMYLMPKGEPTNKDGRIAYVRLEDKSVQASREMKRIMRDSSNNRKVTLQIGEDEKKLLQYLATQKRISLDTYADITGLPRRIASAILVKMTLADIIRIQPQEGGYDFFVEGSV